MLNRIFSKNGEFRFPHGENKSVIFCTRVYGMERAKSKHRFLPYLPAAKTEKGQGLEGRNFNKNLRKNGNTNISTHTESTVQHTTILFRFVLKITNIYK